MSTYIYLVCVCVLEMCEKMGKTYQLAMWGIVRMPAELSSPSLPLPGHYSLGNIRLWMHGGREACLLAKQPW